MTDLRTIINNLVFVIVGYVGEQKKQDKAISEASLKELLNKPHEELMSELTKTIQELELLNYKTRIPLLNYLREIINQLKPLVDQRATLSDNNITLIQKTLVSLIVNLQKLMNLSHNSQETIKYNGEQIELYGFTRGFWSTQCFSSLLLTEHFFLPLEITSKTDENSITTIIKNLITQHQEATITEDSANSTAQITSALTEQSHKMNEKEQEYLDTTEEKLKKKISDLQETKTDLKKEIRGLQNTKSKLKEAISGLQATQSGLEKSIETSRFSLFLRTAYPGVGMYPPSRPRLPDTSNKPTQSNLSPGSSPGY